MEAVDADVSFPSLEEAILKYWKEHDIFQRSMDPSAALAQGVPAKDGKRPSYVFYDGPPFATGLPHYGHLLAGTIKDVVGRYFTMKGYHVDRRFGWDCHGVPVEFEIQKSLDLHGTKAIREFGIGNFNEECRKIVLRYTHEWRQFVERSGRWVDFEREYRTMDLNYMESIWWVVKSLWERDFIYQGLKCVPYSWAINTPLSNFEVNLNYKTVQDPAVTVRAKLRGSLKDRLGLASEPVYPTAAYVWTTTPWTLPSNMAIAIGPEMEYALVSNPAAKESVVVAASLVGQIFPELNEKAAAKKESSSEEAASILARFPGKALVGVEYDPFFPYFEAERAKNAFRIYPGEFVQADEGTGLVHCASFGEEDLGLFLANGITVIDPVDEDGNFTRAVTDFAGMNVKEADSKIVADLKRRGILAAHKTIEHSYPYCWRTDTPLIYKSISTWFVKVESIREFLLHNNSQINWVPEHLRYGRFGKWLEGARDWAISRNRYWGTPIPIWSCEACKNLICIGSVAELEQRTGAKVTDLHSHFVDDLTCACEKCGGSMKRIPEVLDCWFESGAMPYAQAHYPFEGKEEFEQNFPADFIAEGLDQTRGWFYTLLVLSTALLGRPAFRNVIVNGIVLAEDGKKMSKSLKNYPPPDELMNEYGADAMRLYLLSSAATRAEDLRFSKAGVRQVVRQTLLPLWNAYNFFVTYASVDKWTPAHVPAQPSKNLLDRWILSKMASLIQAVDSALGSYHLYSAAPAILHFVDQLTNWYIRLNRRRFWAGNSAESLEDKMHAYATLHQSLLTFVRVVAPITPFMSEEIFLNLKKGVAGLEADSVHLCGFPSLEDFGGLEIDSELESSMEFFEEIILLGRSLRQDHDLKVRQPLAKITIVHPQENVLESLKVLESYIRDELNVKVVDYSTDEEHFVSLKARLNTKALGSVLGPRLGSDGMRKLRTRVENLTSEDIRLFEQAGRIVFDDVELKVGELLIERTVKSGANAVASSGQITAVLDTVLSQELRLEGLAREFVNRVQKLRKDCGFEVSDRILLRYMTACPRLTAALAEHKSYVMEEVLAVDMKEVKDEKQFGLQGTSTHLPDAQEIDGKTVIISVNRMQS